LTACAAGNRLTGYIGTSQASPHVAGLAGLLVAQYGSKQPQRIKQVMEQSGDPIDPAFGRARISVKNALGL
jgi:subtilisin family serine protease